MSRFPVPFPPNGYGCKGYGLKVSGMILGTRKLLSCLCFNRPLSKFKNIPRKKEYEVTPLLHASVNLDVTPDYKHSQWLVSNPRAIPPE